MTDRIHLVGIGGCGMSGLARLLLAQGCRVSGSDLRKVDLPGAEVLLGHHPEHVPKDARTVVHSPAILPANPELEIARKNGMEVIAYPEMLGRLMEKKTGIAVAGTHGKTTTAAMLSFILARAGLEPSYICGAGIPQLGANAAAGKGKHFVAEACEYFRSFHNLVPQCAVITNIEEDHLDYYRDIEEITQSFREFAGKVKEDGVVIGSLDSPPAAEIVKQFKGRGETFSLTQEADWRARNIEIREGRWTFEVVKYGKTLGRVHLTVPGNHNVANTLAAIAAANWAGVGQEIIMLSVDEYEGSERRMQVIGKTNGSIVMDDYAHHPTEVQATLKALRERYPDKKLWVVFQPHLYSRTRQFLKDFARSFGDADLILLTDVYAARDADDKRKINSDALAKLVDERGKAALYLPSFDEVERFLRDKMPPDCVVVTMGAGDIGEVAHRLVR